MRTWILKAFLAGGWISLLSLNTFANFYPVTKNTSQTPDKVLEASQAVFHLNSFSGRCTASAISNDGYFLTARHCLQSCLIQSHVFKYAQKSKSEVPYFVLDQNQLQQAACEVDLDHKSVNVTIEATSEGLISRIDETSFSALHPQKYERLFEKAYTSEGDFVIFKVSKPSKKYSCLKLPKDTDHLNKESHFTIGFPSKTSRPTGLNSNGSDMYYSYGVKLASILDNSCVQKSTSLKDFQKQNLQASFDLPTSFISTVDAIYGSSGSSLVNNEQEVLGILTNVYRHAFADNNEASEPENIYCRGSAKALKIQSILEILKNIHFDVDQISCQ